MTDERMALLELIEKGADADLVRELLAYASQRPRAAEVDRLTGAVGPGHGAGARRPDRTGSTTATGTASGRERRSRRETRVGRIELAIPKLRKSSYFPASLEPRRTAEKAPTAVIHREQGSRSLPAGTMASRPSRGSPRAWRLDPLGRRPGQGDGRHRHPEEPGLAPVRGHRRARPGLPLAADRGKLALSPARRDRPTSNRATAAAPPASPS